MKPMNKLNLKKKQFLKKLLCLTLCASLVGSPAFAEPVDGNTPENPPAVSNETGDVSSSAGTATGTTTETGSAGSSQQENAATSQPAQSTVTQKPFSTGLAPLWSFVEIKAPEQVAVGKDFEVNITVKNYGTGPGMHPIFTFTEDAEKKPLSHFSIQGADGDTYDTMLTEVPGGETKTFTLKFKVNEDTRELPEGSKYRINCTIASDDWQMMDTKSYKAVQSFYVEVVYAMTDPSFVVQGVKFNPEISGDITETTATFTIKNVSDSKANNVLLTLAGKATKDGEKNISVEDLSATKRIGNISGNQTFTVDYKLKLNESRKDNEMVMTIDYNGADKPQEIALNMPLPILSQSGREPKVIIERYNVSPTKVLAGNFVTLTLNIQNTNVNPVNNVSIRLEVPTSTSENGSVSGGTVFSPVDSSNTFYLDSIPGKSTVSKSIDMYVDPNASAKTYIVPVEMSYESYDGENYTAKDNVNIPVTQESKVDIIRQNIPKAGNVGEPAQLELEFVNVGKVNLTNFKVALAGDLAAEDEQVYYMGTFNAGESDEYTATIFPSEEGTLTGNIVISFIDANHQNTTMEIPVSMEVGPMIEYDMPDDFGPMPEPEKESPLKAVKDNLLTILVGLIAIVEGAVLFKNNRKKKAEEELLNDEN